MDNKILNCLNTFLIRVYFSITIVFGLLLPLTVVEGNELTPHCSGKNWSTNIRISNLKKLKVIPINAESMQATLYRDSQNKLIVIADIYNSVIEGQAKILDEGNAYNASLSYRVHSDTTTEINGAKAIIFASYSANRHQIKYYCYELLDGDMDNAKNIADDVLAVIVDIATKAIKAK